MLKLLSAKYNYQKESMERKVNHMILNSGGVLYLSRAFIAGLSVYEVVSLGIACFTNKQSKVRLG